jgi:acyl-CoA thioesterase-2
MARHIPNATEILQLDTIGVDRFRAGFNLDNMAGVTFGGQALGQSLVAATQTIEDWPCHSLSGIFMRGGNIDAPIEYSVERLKDGRSFASRRVRAEQNGRAIFEMLCSFHSGEAGLKHQFANMGNPPDPESLLNLQDFAKMNNHRLPAPIADILSKPYIFEVCLLEPEQYFKTPTSSTRDFWFRIPSAVDVEEQHSHQALLALMSDYWMPGTIAVTHGAEASTRSMSSLNHSLWIHAPVRANEWLLYRTESDWAQNGRGLCRGHIFKQSGQLVASATQEALLR